MACPVKGEDGTVGHALGHHHVVAGGHRRNLSIVKPFANEKVEKLADTYLDPNLHIGNGTPVDGATMLSPEATVEI